MSENKYNLREYLAFMGSQVLEDNKTVFVGTGLPIIACMLAQKTHAPNLVMVFEAGGVALAIRLPVVKNFRAPNMMFFVFAFSHRVSGLIIE